MAGAPLALAAHLAVAQQPAAAPRAGAYGTLAGIVDDSLRGGQLRGATVIIAGTTRRGVTNERGEFFIDSVLPGEHRFAVRHPLFDTLGIALISPTFTLGPAQQLGTRVATPTLDQVRARSCARGGVSYGTGMLFGRVLEADTDAPLRGASVSLVYREAGAGRGGAAGAGPGPARVRQTRSNDDGSFAICGLPSDLSGTVQAARGGESTAELPVAMDAPPLTTAVLTLSESRDTAAVLEGRVVNRAGLPVPDAQVALTGTSKVAIAGPDGAFALRGLPAGTKEAVVRRIGFAQASRVVHLTSREPRRVTITLAEAQVLSTVRVVGQMDDGLKKVGFADRRRSSGGRFLTPEDISQRRPEYFTDLVRSLPGFRVANTGFGRMIQSTRGTGSSDGGCVNFFIDRSRYEQMQPGDLDDALRIANLGAVETYPSATSTPAEFQVPGRACATIVVWSKTTLGKP